jgi:hypothetical protein
LTAIDLFESAPTIGVDNPVHSYSPEIDPCFEVRRARKEVDAIESGEIEYMLLYLDPLRTAMRVSCTKSFSEYLCSEAKSIAG